MNIPLHSLSLHFREHFDALHVVRFNFRPLIVAAWDWIFEQDWDDLHSLFRRQRVLRVFGSTAVVFGYDSVEGRGWTVVDGAPSISLSTHEDLCEAWDRCV